MIIIDDGSKDNSPIIVEEYSKRDGENTINKTKKMLVQEQQEIME